MRLTLLLLLLVSFESFASFIPTTFQMKFEQVIKSSLTGKEKSSLGEMDYKYPGKVRFEIKGLNPVLYVSNSKLSWYYTPPFIEGESGQVTIKEKGNIVLSNFFDRMKLGLKDNKYYKVKTIDPKNVEIVFEEQSRKDLGIKLTKLNFVKVDQKFSSLKSLELTYSNDKKVMLKIISVKAPIDFKKNNFEFKTPPNTKIVR